jgi:hypothetical protein
MSDQTIGRQRIDKGDEFDTEADRASLAERG